MKTLHFPLRLLALLTALVLASGAFTPRVSAQASPVGSWDCAITGNQLGLALFIFESDFTFSGVQYQRPGPLQRSAVTQPTDPRHPGGEPTRTGTEPVPTVSAPATNFIGSTELKGIWGYDESGKVIGLLDQVESAYELVDKTVTNSIVVTNIVGGIEFLTPTNVVTTTNVLELVFKTNAVSFRAVVVPGKRISLGAFLARGRNIYTGQPAIPLADLSGSYTISGKRGNIPFVEFLTFSPNPDYLNEYVVEGMGPGYGFTGYAMPSRRNGLAIYNQIDRDPYTITVCGGAFNLTTGRGTLNGQDTSGRKLTYRIMRQP